MAGRILIVDNVPTSRIILKVKLSKAFYEVMQAASGREAMACAIKDQPDIIILDTDLGDMSAHELCALLKSTPATRYVPVLIATPADDTEAKIAALKAGADEFLTKPIDEPTLIARVRALMRALATTDELRRRNNTAHALGFAEAPASFTAPGKISLVGRNAEDAMTWRAGLRGLINDDIDIVHADRLLETIANGHAADVYLISSDMSDGGSGLRLIADIRARHNTRSAGIVVVHEDQNRDDAVMALDLGANDVITRGSDPEEMALRLRSQMRRKIQADVLRTSVDEDLRLAMMDPLTGLYNRRYALPYLTQVMQQSVVSGQHFAIMLIDLDHFKGVNDTFGHAIGDQVLTEVAKRLRDNMRGIDLIARFGGEEFLICMPMTSLVQARAAAERVRSVLCATPVATAADGTLVSTSASIGLSMGGTKHVGIETLLEIADRALYHAKAEGRNQVTLGSYAA